MTNLLIVDFRRVLKDKLLLVMGILAVAFSLLNGLIMGVAAGFMTSEDMEMMTAMGMGLEAKSQFFSAFSFGNNVGLIAPVLLAIILCKDFGSGTIRNKIIAGYSRVSILLSLFIVCLTVMFAVMLLYAVLTLVICLFFMPFQSGDFGAGDAGYLLLSLGLEFLLYLMASALIAYLCASQKNVGLVIVLYVAVVMVLTLLGSILASVAMVLESLGGYDNALNVIDVIQRINPLSFSMEIGQGSSYESGDLLNYVLAPLGLTVLFLGWGILKFKKKDLK